VCGQGLQPRGPPGLHGAHAAARWVGGNGYFFTRLGAATQGHCRNGWQRARRRLPFTSSNGWAAFSLLSLFTGMAPKTLAHRAGKQTYGPNKTY
jgi:hypothetical protein